MNPQSSNTAFNPRNIIDVPLLTTESSRKGPRLTNHKTYPGDGASHGTSSSTGLSEMSLRLDNFTLRQQSEMARLINRFLDMILSRAVRRKMHVV